MVQEDQEQHGNKSKANVQAMLVVEPPGQVELWEIISWEIFALVKFVSLPLRQELTVFGFVSRTSDPGLLVQNIHAWYCSKTHQVPTFAVLRFKFSVKDKLARTKLPKVP